MHVHTTSVAFSTVGADNVREMSAPTIPDGAIGLSPFGGPRKTEKLPAHDERALTESFDMRGPEITMHGQDGLADADPSLLAPAGDKAYARNIRRNRKGGQTQASDTRLQKALSGLWGQSRGSDRADRTSKHPENAAQGRAFHMREVPFPGPWDAHKVPSVQLVIDKKLEPRSTFRRRSLRKP
eukprot:9164645-Alexandrium_andersonii.AAC.1